MNRERRCDPPVRADGLCAVCGKPRKREGLRAVYRDPAERDPFCSAECAREFHGVKITRAPVPPRAYVSKLPPTA